MTAILVRFIFSKGRVNIENNKSIMLVACCLLIVSGCSSREGKVVGGKVKVLQIEYWETTESLLVPRVATWKLKR